MQSSIWLKADSTRSAYFKDDYFATRPMSDHPHGGKKVFLFLFEMSCFATCAHLISSCPCAPLKRVHLHLPPVSTASCRSCAPSAWSPGGWSWVLIATWSCPCCHGEPRSGLSPPSGLWQELGRGQKCFSLLCQLCCGSYSMICGLPPLLQGCTSDWFWTGCT